jgi:hypothetical protein
MTGKMALSGTKMKCKMMVLSDDYYDGKIVAKPLCFCTWNEGITD